MQQAAFEPLRRLVLLDLIKHHVLHCMLLGAGYTAHTQSSGTYVLGGGGATLGAGGDPLTAARSQAGAGGEGPGAAIGRRERWGEPQFPGDAVGKGQGQYYAPRESLTVHAAA